MGVRTLNVCRRGHTAHDTINVDTVMGEFTVWDWSQYRDYPGYCTGQDDLSMTLDLYGIWEEPDWSRAKRFVESREPGWTYDFGAHIGWYTIAFALAGHYVLAVEADPANCELLALNVRNFGVSDKVKIVNAWASDVKVPTRDVVFLKSDVEGSEDDVVEACAPSVYARRVEAMLLECSPEFADYYPDLITELEGIGYGCEPRTFETQVNVWVE